MSNLIIVALPSEDDYINKISSEQVAHMTLLFLGEDVRKISNLDKITSFVEHAVNEMLARFNLYVDRRGVLGEDSADVIFFRKTGYCFKDINNFRSALLQENNIRTAFDSAFQHEEWAPHLTLGYPDTPAKPDDRDYPGIYSVGFDRIAVWDQDYAGTEFLLESENDDYMMMSMGERVVDDILEHHGVPGMKWGHRSGTTITGSSSGKRTRADKKFEKNASNLKTYIKIHNAAADRIEKSGDMERINNKPKWKKAFANNEFTQDKDPDHNPKYHEYIKEHQTAFLKHVQAAADSMGTNESGTRKYGIVTDVNGNWGVTAVDVAKHADDNILFSYRVVMSQNGEIVKLVPIPIDTSMLESTLAQSAIEHILTHHGTDKV